MKEPMNTHQESFMNSIPTYIYIYISGLLQTPQVQEG